MRGYGHDGFISGSVQVYRYISLAISVGFTPHAFRPVEHHPLPSPGFHAGGRVVLVAHGSVAVQGGQRGQIDGLSGVGGIRAIRLQPNVRVYGFVHSITRQILLIHPQYTDLSGNGCKP